jgi:hypothetical protein
MQAVLIKTNRACGMRERKEIHTELKLVELKGRDYLGDLGINGSQY